MGRDRQRDINGFGGQTGGLPALIIDGDYTLSELNAGQTLYVTAEATITCPVGAGAPGPGFFCEVVRYTADAVDVIAGADANVESSVGPNPSIAAQFQGATITRVPSDLEADTWLVIGALA